ncbi:NAD-dependent epimerase/dehydratase family protein [Thermoflavimicrobium daqui]|uniref:3-beta hydroxysteroid dehydrogenase n=1 Tax=Thermoflavimicrobium daqui TaxID=2137476 RepID=A0A364K561_9BACL|nr:NAD(P)-dependent oxidoreductase [Thermoflavimicrobium daqui]RAL24486.1 3-beta hydroxysteroid dehydrogenase [Thermoflavimicrobium daqui]
MNVLVTGATGFLGQRLALRLHQLGYNVTATGRSQQKGAYLAEQGISFIPANLEDTVTIQAMCKNQDYVFHSGALSSPWGPYEHFYQSNVIGTKNLIEGCMQYPVRRLIHVSTPSIYFHYTDRLQIKEEEPLPKTKVNAYAETKWLAEQEIDRAFQEGLPVITIRPRALFGPGDQAILPRLLQANERRFIPLINGGKVWIDLTYIDNVVDALLLCMNSSSNTLGKKYNITNDEPVLLKDVLTEVFKLLEQPMRTKSIPFRLAYLFAGCLEWYARILGREKEPELTRYTVGVLGKSQTLDISKAKQELGYQPKVSIEEGIKRFVKWWKKQ